MCDDGEMYLDVPKTLAPSMLFQCNLYRLFPGDTTNASAQCMVCKRNGLFKVVKGKTTTNYHLHMKRLHHTEYDSYQEVKRTGIIKHIVPLEDVSDHSDCERTEQPSLCSLLFEHNFFEVRVRLPNKNIKANCLTCQRMGRQNLIQARENVSSNLLAHLKRMHPAEYQRYSELKKTYQPEYLVRPPTQLPGPSMSSHFETDVEQSVVSTIKSEDLEFVDVNQDEMPAETWDSFDSSDFFEAVNDSQAVDESAATSTSNINRNDQSESKVHGNISVNEELNVYDNNRGPLLFRGGFFRFIKKEGVTVRAECLSCKQGNVYSGHMASCSNFVKHLNRMHPRDYDRYIAMKNEHKAAINVDRNEYLNQKAAKFEQSDFNRIVLNFMINGMHPPNLLEDPTFATLLNDIAFQRKSGDSLVKPFHIISPQVLNAEIEERLKIHEENLTTMLQGTFSVSLSVDVWLVQEKTFLLFTVNRVDPVNFQRVSNVIACDVFNEPIRNSFIDFYVHKRCVSYGIEDKIVAVVTNNNPQYDPDGALTDGISYLEIKGLENQIKNPIHIFERIGTEMVFEKCKYVDSAKLDLLAKQVKKKHLSEKCDSFLKEVFNHQAIGSRVAEKYNIVSNLLNCDPEALNEVMEQLEITKFTKTEMDLFREYSVIVEPIATAIEYLQKNDCCYATLLPMVYSMKENLMDVKNRGQILLCQPLLDAVLKGVDQNFNHLFDFSNEKITPALIATCTHPFFKMRWLKGDMKTPANTNKILDLLVKVAKECDVEIKEETTDTSTSISKPPDLAMKKFKFSFDMTSEEEPNNETVIQMDFMSFWKTPCQNDESNLEELKLHPWVQKLFIRYNSILPSTAALERHIPLSDLIRKSQSVDYSDEIFSKLGLLRTTEHN